MRFPELTKRRQILVGGLVLAAGGLVAAKKVLRVHFRKPPIVGKQIPPMTLEFVSNAAGPFTLPPGKVTLLDFFGSTCVACRASLPKVQHRIQEPDVRFVAVSIDDERADAQKIASTWGIVAPVAWDSHGEAREAFQIVGVPNLVVLSRRGRITGWFPFHPSDSLLDDAIADAREDDTT
jgi:thiol-disulfide isomerase/thioredoxin